jgi:hypothetical protein
MASSMTGYLTQLRKGFSEYRDAYFVAGSNVFEDRAEGEAVVFKSAYRDQNLIIPPCSASKRAQIIAKIPRSKRHRHFGSMQSSQALAQSVFGAIETCGRLPLLSAIKAEDGRLAFGTALNQTSLELEKDIDSLGEQLGRSTSVDVWFEGPYRVAVECKLSEAAFGTCSRTRLEPGDKQHCDGSYTLQGERKMERCSLTQVGVRYWNYSEAAFGWSADIDHRRCPMSNTYQLMRNVLAACVVTDGALDEGIGHALVIYDQRNPSMAEDGECGRQWREIFSALRNPGTLRPLSWQSLIAQWPNDDVLDWLRSELRAKYGLCP